MAQRVVSWSRRDNHWLLAPVLAVLVMLIATWIRSSYGHGDINLYHRYAMWFVGGHSLPVEYPVLSIVPFLATLVPPDFVISYAGAMLLLFVFAYLAYDRFASARAANALAVYVLAGCAVTALARFDLVPSLVTVAALWMASRRRFGWSYVLLAVGVLLKLYPLFLLPVVMIEHRRVLHFRGGGLLPAPVLKGAGWFALVIAAGMLLAVLAEPNGWWTPFQTESRRPIQVEAVQATLLWLSSFAGFHAQPNHSFHSFNMVGSLQGVLNLAGSLGLVAGCLYVYWRQYRGRIDTGRAFLGVVCVVMVTSKLFSPQYVLWVLPLVALVEGLVPIWLVISLLTTLIYPILYEADNLHGMATPSHYSWRFLVVIAIRNGLLLWATYRTVVPREARPEEVSEEEELRPRLNAVEGEEPVAGRDEEASVGRAG